MRHVRLYSLSTCPTCKLVRDFLVKYGIPFTEIKEYGSCYCGLYVSKEWNEDKIPRKRIPERRHKENKLYET